MKNPSIIIVVICIAGIYAFLALTPTYIDPINAIVLSIVAGLIASYIGAFVQGITSKKKEEKEIEMEKN